MSRVAQLRHHPRTPIVIGVLGAIAVALFPLFRPPLDGLTNDAILALAFVVMALGLNLVVGFAGLLDLGYVAFYALARATSCRTCRASTSTSCC
jgi:branched-chain amino acid transport system permease protein